MAFLSDCKNPDGSTDWKRYHELEAKEREERKNKGEICYRCSRFIIWSKGYPQSCDGCKDIEKREELRHDSKVRCPGCGHNWSVGDGDQYELYEEGEHEVSCDNCDLKFEITTYVSHTFISPERLKEPKEQEEADEA